MSQKPDATSINRDMYHFVSEWHIHAGVKRVEEALIKTEDWQKWWDGLESIETTFYEPGVGAEYDCVWRSMTGYRLRFHIKITKYEPEMRIAFEASGDLVGTGEFLMREEGADATEIVIRWDVSTTKKWMRLLGPVLRPLFVINHDKLMRAGEVGLAKYIVNLHN